MLFFKILQQFFSPSVFIFILLLIGLIFLFKRKKIGSVLTISALVFYYLFSITPFADLLLAFLENDYKRIEQVDLDRADKIVFMLGGVNPNKELKGASLMGESTLFRANEVLRIYLSKNEEAEIIVSGANPLDNKEETAKKVKEAMTEIGVEPDDLILDEKSINTEESAKNLKDYLKNEPFFLVTSAFHMRRSVIFFEKYELRPIPAPADFRIQKNYSLFDFFPNPKNLENIDLATHEYLGIIYSVIER